MKFITKLTFGLRSIGSETWADRLQACNKCRECEMNWNKKSIGLVGRNLEYNISRLRVN